MRSASLFPLFASVTSLKGVGPQIAAALGRLLYNDDQRIPRIIDLIFHLPSGVIDRRFSPPLHSAPEDTVCTFVVKVEAHYPPGTRMYHASKKPYRVLCSNETGDLTLVFFNPRPEYIKNALPEGAMRVISGRTEKFDFRLQMTHPDIIAPEDKLAEIQTVEPHYPLTANLSNKKLAGIIAQALERLPDMEEWIDAELMALRHWPSWKDALLKLHRPQSQEEAEADMPEKERLVYDELLAMQLHLANVRHKATQKEGIKLTDKKQYTQQLMDILPYPLTVDQSKAITEIGEHLASGKRMVQLLQGDVGSGKTIVALFAMLRAAEHHKQAALMVPTELIAYQHYHNLKPYCDKLGVGITLLTGSVKGIDRKAALLQISSGDAQIIIGTHALFQEKVEFKSLALTVIDEQHRFGVEQRMALTYKGQNPHILHLSATPIPRSLMMTLYGDMDSISLKEKPAGRKPIATAAIPLSRYGELLERLEQAFARGEKAYWICPLIDDSKTAENKTLFDEDIAAAESRWVEFNARFGDKVGLVHGRMPQERRSEIMQKFADGEFQLLVATTVIEVGVDISDATIMIIERAERFGLSQLHQLRGRVGRGEKPSSCVLLYSDLAGEISRERLSILRDTDDGFKIAEADLAMRGGGELLGSRQAGLPRFRFANIFKHGELLQLARTHAEKVIETYHDLTQEQKEALNTLIELYKI